MTKDGKETAAVELELLEELDATEEIAVEPEAADALDGQELVKLVLAAHEARLAKPQRIDGVLVGRLTACDPMAIVDFPGGPAGGVRARMMASLGPEDVGCEVALLFEEGDPARPVIMGKMASSPTTAPSPRAEVKDDGERLEIRAEKEIVLSCGAASITLTRAGKILIRGAYVLSRSSGVHRIQGGSVQIN